MHPATRSKQQPFAMYETSVGTIARSRRQLGTAQCEAELRRKTKNKKANYFSEPQALSMGLALPVRRWVGGPTGAAISGWSPVRSAGGSAAVCFWGRSPRPATPLDGLPCSLRGRRPSAPPPRTKGRRKSDSLSGVSVETLHSPDRRSVGWAVYCLAQDAAR